MRMPLGKKIGLGFGVVLTLMVFTAVLGCYKISVAHAYDQDIITLQSPVQLHNRTLSVYLTRSQSKQREYILLADDVAAGARAHQDWEKTWGDIDTEVRALGDFSSRFTLPEDKANVVSIREQLVDLRKLQESCFQVRQPHHIETMIPAGHCLIQGNVVTANIRTAMDGIDHNAQQAMKADIDKLASANGAIYQALTWCTILAVGLGCFIAFRLSREITIAITEVLTRSEAISVQPQRRAT